MTDRDQMISEDELHAYVDGELPADRRGAVEAWLAAHADDAARVAAWRAQAELIRKRYGGVGSEMPPKRLQVERLTPQPPRLDGGCHRRRVRCLHRRRRRRLVRARRRSRLAVRSRSLHRRCARSLSALRGRSPPSGRSARRSAPAPRGVAVEAARLAAARARARTHGTETRRRPTVARPDRSDGVLHV